MFSWVADPESTKRKVEHGPVRTAYNSPMKVQATQWKQSIALLFLAGVFFMLIIFQAEFLWFGIHFEDLGRFLYRPAVIMLAPFRGFAILITPPHRAHFPVIQTALLCLMAPAVFFTAWRLARRFYPWRKPGRTTTGNHSISRRGFLALCGATPLSGAGVYGIYVEPERLRVARYTVPVADLPPALDGLRMVHVSDTHYGPFVTARYLREVMARINALTPDLIVLTGDYVHKTPRAIGSGIGILRELHATLGVVAVLGNHEHWEGVEACRERFREVGIPLLDNRRCFLTKQGIVDEERVGESLCLAGVGDLWEGQPSLKAALDGVAPGIPRLLLSHNPDFAEAGNDGYRVDLMLSGHTHGGQVRLPIIGAPCVPSRFGEKYAGGLCHGPWCPVLVSRGVGLAGLPIRLGVPPEIGLIQLRGHRP